MNWHFTGDHVSYVREPRTADRSCVIIKLRDVEIKGVISILCALKHFLSTLWRYFAQCFVKKQNEGPICPHLSRNNNPPQSRIRKWFPTSATFPNVRTTRLNLKLEKSSGLHPNFKIITLFSSLKQNKICASFVPQSNTVSLLLGLSLHLHRWEQVMVGGRWHTSQWKTDFNSISDRYNQTFNSDYFFNSNNH